MLCVLGGGVAAAQNTNSIPIVHRIYRYSSHAQMLGGSAANLPPPPPSADDIPIPGRDDLKLDANLTTAIDTTTSPAPMHRPDQKKGKEQQLKSLFVTDSAATNKVDPDIKRWGWLAEEADANRQVLESYHKPQPSDESWTNGLAGQAETNAAQRAKLGSLKGNAYEPLGADHNATSNVARVVEDRIARATEKNKQDEAKQKAAQKDGMNMAGKHDLPPTMTATNETLGLTRSRRDDERSDVTLDSDFSQTRKAMAEITSRYHLNLTMADILRRPAAPPPEVASSKTLSARNVPENDGTLGLGGDMRRTTPAIDYTAGMAATARAPAPPPSGMPGGGPAWMKAPSSAMPMANSASAMVEGPKNPKAYEMQAPLVQAPPPQSTPATYVPQPSYTPASILPSSYTPGGRTPGSLTPIFTPTAPYRNLFDPTPSR